MNYPTVMRNPLLKKRDNRQFGEENIMDRPLSFHPKPTTSAQRPFSTKEGGETLMHKRKALQYKPMVKDTSQEALPGLLKAPNAQDENAYDKGVPHS